MKAFKFENFKSIGRNIAYLSIAASLLTACGSKDKSESNQTRMNVPRGTSPVFGNPTSGGGNNQQNLNIWNNLKSQNNCRQGRMQDLTFKYQSSGGSYYGGTTLSGYLQSGSHSGYSQGSYYGKSCNGDLIYVSRVSSGSTSSYNVVLSFCIWSDGYTQFIGPNAQMSQYFVDQVVLNGSETNTNGGVMSGKIGFFSPAFGGYIPIEVMSASMSCPY